MRGDLRPSDFSYDVDASFRIQRQRNRTPCVPNYQWQIELANLLKLTVSDARVACAVTADRPQHA